MALRHAEIALSFTVRGSQSPKTGLIRFQQRNQSSRVRGALRSHSSVSRNALNGAPTERGGYTVSISISSGERSLDDSRAGEGASPRRVASHLLFHASAMAHA